MTDVTITGNDGAVFTFADGELSGIRTQLNPDIEVNPLPGSGPSQALAFDFNGVLKTISLSGVLFETTTSRVDTSSVTTLLEQVQWLEKQLNGTQLARIFTSNYASQTFDGTSFVTTKILAGSFDFNENAGDPERLPFTINLLVGSE
jgi:hypothetical protein